MRKVRVVLLLEIAEDQGEVVQSGPIERVQPIQHGRQRFKVLPARWEGPSARVLDVFLHQSESIGRKAEEMAQEAHVARLRMPDPSFPTADRVPVHARLGCTQLNRGAAQPIRDIILRPSPPLPFPE